MQKKVTLDSKIELEQNRKWGYRRENYFTIVMKNTSAKITKRN